MDVSRSDAFHPGGDLSIGAEEELLLVDGTGRLITGGTDDLLASIRSVPFVGGLVAAELFSSVVEFATVVCADADELLRALQGCRSALRRVGAQAVAAGLHPAGEFGKVDLTPSPRYDVISTSLAGLVRTPTAAYQVHVGLPDAEAAVTAYRALRNRLPLLRALATASPYWHSRDSGLASARWAVLRSYPRTGIPPAASSWAEYAELTAGVVRTAQVADYTHLWWDLRIQPRLGTVEVRCMDAQPSLTASAGIAALAQGLVAAALEDPDPVDLPHDVLSEGDFLVARHGRDARITDLDGSLQPVEGLLQRETARARHALGARGGGLEAVARLLADEPEHERQRRVHAIGGMPGLLADLHARTTVGM